MLWGEKRATLSATIDFIRMTKSVFIIKIPFNSVSVAARLLDFICNVIEFFMAHINPNNKCSNKS